ncbi:MAG TPA: hypothetical protein VFR85_00045 [Anaeromyxobacteraceae bacterium]|nr:hypothetical protein [Anaeromyxobacteraceae bacterium]
MPLRRAALLALLLGTCVERAPGSGSARPQPDRAAAAAWLSPGALPRHASRAVFGNVIALDGWDLEPEALSPGVTATLTLHWRALDEVEGAWKVFVHVDGRAGQPRINADHLPAGGAWPTDAWSRGDRVRDPVRFGVPPGWRGEALDVWVGWYQGEERLRIVNAAELRTDRRDRLFLTSIPLAPIPLPPAP